MEPGSVAPARPTYGLAAVVSLAVAGTLAGYQVISFLPEYLNLEARVVTVPFRAGMASLYLLLLVLGLCARQRLPLSKTTLALGVFWLLYLFRLLLDTTIAEVPLHLPRDEFFACVLGMSLLPLLAFLMAPGGAH